MGKTCRKEKSTDQEILMHDNESWSLLKIIWHRKQKSIMGSGIFSWVFLIILQKKMMGKATCDRKSTQLLYDMLENIIYAN